LLSGTRTIRLGIGDDSSKLPRAGAMIETPIKIRAWEPRILVAGALGLLLLAGGIVASGWYTGLMRDSTTGPVRDAPFSLARVQFTWWFFLVFGGFLFIWLVTGQFIGVITPGVLTLLGISGVSGVAARMMDKPDPAAASPAPKTSSGFFWDILGD